MIGRCDWCEVFGEAHLWARGRRLLIIVELSCSDLDEV